MAQKEDANERRESMHEMLRMLERCQGFLCENQES